MLNLIRTAEALGVIFIASAASAQPATSPPVGVYHCAGVDQTETASDMAILGSDRYRDGSAYGHYEYDPSSGILRFRSGPFDVRPYGSEWIGVFRGGTDTAAASSIEIRRQPDNRIMQRCTLASR